LSKLIDRLLRNNASLFIIVFGAVSFFITNILMKEILSSRKYGEYSILITYFSVVYLLGILGAEQGFLRYSKRINTNVIATHKSQLNLLVVISICTSIVFCLLFKYFYNEIEINTFLLFTSTISMVIMLFLFNILRLNENFIASQLFSNYWKNTLLVLAVVFFIWRNTNLTLFVNILSVNIILITVIALFFVKTKLKFVYISEINTKEICISAFHFSLAIFAITLIIFSDRFIIERKHNIEEFGNYFYLTNFFLAPFSILQNYIGFKQLIIFKTNFSFEYFKAINKKVLLLGFFISLILFSLSFIIDYLNIVKFDFNKYVIIIIILLITGIVRLYSSAILSAFEAKTNIRTLRNSNIYIISATIGVISFILIFVTKLEFILVFFIIIWLFRSIIHKKLLMKQLKNNSDL